jgi:hypothetical protein
MFCAFIDFEKAFATDWREGLWCKLLMNNINGKMHNVIPLVNMYQPVTLFFSKKFPNHLSIKKIGKDIRFLFV